MIYGDKKSFHMAKSILPSTRREYSQWKRPHIHRETRRNNKQTLHEIARDYDYSDDGLSFEECESRVNSMKYERRGGDKLHHFMEWAKAITKDMPRDNRLSYMKSLLPKDTIGEHALGHLKHLDEFETEAEQSLSAERVAAYVARKKHHKDYDYEALLYDLVASGFHSNFNDLMHIHHKPVYGLKTVWIGGIKTSINVLNEELSAIRVLLGIHDIPMFVKDLTTFKANSVASRHPEWGRTLRGLANHYDKCYGDWTKTFDTIREMKTPVW